MNEAEFHEAARSTLMRIEQAIEASGADIDFENVSDILTLDFANGSKLIINKQSVARQLWVAARSGGFHYDFDATGPCWRNDQNGTELFSDLTRLVSEQAGVPITLT